MKLETKIKGLIAKIQYADNTADKQHYLQKLNECKRDLIDLLCYNNDYFYCYYSQDHDKEYGYRKECYIKSFNQRYKIKRIYTALDNNFNTQIINIDFDI